MRELRPGVHVLRWRTGADPFTGKSRQQQETFHGTKKAAQQRLNQLLARGRSSTNATLGDLLVSWDEAASVAPSTMTRYKFALEHLPDAMRRLPLAQVTPPLIAKLHRQLDDKGVGHQSIRKLHTALSSAFRHALEWGLVDRNPCRGIRTPAIEPRDYVVPTVAQLRRIFELADEISPDCGIFVRLATGSGARRVELVGLRWREVDLEAGRIRVLRSTTKTDAGERIVTLDLELVAQLRAWRARAIERALSVGASLSSGAYVISFDPTSAKPWRLELATKRLSRLTAAAGCPGATLHDLRHTHATMLLEAGVSLKAVSERLGHSRPQTTANLYWRSLPGADEQAAAVFGQLMGG